MTDDLQELSINADLATSIIFEKWTAPYLDVVWLSSIFLQFNRGQMERSAQGAGRWKGMRFLSINRVIKNATITTTAVMITIITELSMSDNQNANRFGFFLFSQLYLQCSFY